MRRLIMREVGYLLIVRDNTRKNGLFFFFLSRRVRLRFEYLITCDEWDEMRQVGFFEGKESLHVELD